MKWTLSIITILILVSCSNNASNESEGGDGFTTDTSSVHYQRPGNPDIVFSRPGNSLSSGDDPESIRKRELIYMGIDSTYNAIRQIEEIKKEIGSTSAIHLSSTERNFKTKAIMKLNLIENTLARQVDSALLINLKTHTRQLETINNSISENAEHLKEIAVKLDRVSLVMQRLTDVLGLCISKGLVKPPTPVSSSPAEVKSNL